jgi:hypothetical protein
MRTCPCVITAAILLAAGTTPAAAHHEAIYGAHSALGVSSDRYISAQTFTRTVGPAGERVRETTTVLSGGLSPGGGPVSLAVVVPFSVIAGEPGRGTRLGLENAIVAGRYRVNLPGLSRLLRTEEGYVLGVGGIEIPTGTIDYGFFEGAPAVVGGLTVGLERRPVSMIGYAYMNRYAERNDIRASGHRFAGVGVAWTPIDDEPNGRLLSVQFGISRDSATREIVNGVAQDATGGWTTVAHPAVVWSTRPGVLWFVSTSLPVRSAWRDPGDREHFRIGAGAIVSLGR